MAGLKPSVRALGLLTGWKVLALLAVPAVAFLAGKGSFAHFEPFVARRPGAPPLGGALAAGLVGVFFSFGGFWEASRVAGEIRDPGRTLPRALALGVGVVTLAYVATTLAFVYLVPVGQVTSAAGFARRAGEAMLGPAGSSVFAAVVVLSATASAGALLLMAPRVYLAMSRDGLFPAALAKLSNATGAPVRATALLASMATVLILSGTFQEILAFFMCPTLVFVALSASALLVFHGRGAPPPPFRCPGYPVTLVLFVLFIAVVVVIIAFARPLPALSGFAIVLAGLSVYGALSGRGAVGRHAGGSP
jgi:APA family basic amino acid/polyamine antiporter